MSIVDAAEVLELDPADLADAAVYGSRVALATVVNRLLVAKGWTRARLATELNLSGGRVSQILNTETGVSFATVVRVLHALGIDMGDCLHACCGRKGARGEGYE